VPPRRHNSAGFSLVDVMMGATILVVGLMGLIQAVTIGSEMLATARRQTLAAQILDQEIETLRFLPWNDPNSTNDIVGLAAGPTTLTIHAQFRKAWSASTAYVIGEVTSSNNVWYRCTAAHTNQAVTNTSYWARATLAQVDIMSDTNKASGATYALTRTVTDVAGATNLREVTFTVTWTVKPSGITSRTYTRMKSAYFGKYGLNQTLQRS
jgi:Tfp pilus assembly protein PilV